MGRLLERFEPLVTTDDGESVPNPDIERFAALIGEIPELWDVRVRAGEIEYQGLTIPTNVGYFMSTYLNPKNYIYVIGDYEGVIGFTKVQTGYRANSIAGLKTRNSKILAAKHGLFRAAAKATMELEKLLVIDAFVAETNKLGQNACVKNGMLYRGSIPKSICYDSGVVVDARWYELTREAVGLESNHG
jgi:hypothetical protein